jgi:hypothetical protein
MIKSEKGVVLIFAMSIITALAIVGSTMVVRSMTESGVTRIDQNEHHSLVFSEAALDRGLRNLYVGNESDISSTPISGGAFWAEIYDHNEDANLTEMQRRIVGHGSEESHQRNVELITARTEKSVFRYAVFADEDIGIQGSVITDSYDSRDGAYDEDNHSHNGDIGTNGTIVGSVDFNGAPGASAGYFIDGQVFVGPGVEDPESIVTNYDPSFVTGGTSPPSDGQDVLSAAEEFPLPPVTVPQGVFCAPETRIDNKADVVLPPGDYCYRNLTVLGGAHLTSSGPVKIYITGTFDLGGNGSVIGVASDPTQLLIIMTGNDAKAKIDGDISGTTTLYGGIYAPEADLKLYGNAQVFGAVVSNSISVEGDAMVHYDEAMEDIDDLTNRWENDVLFWHEINPGE